MPRLPTFQAVEGQPRASSATMSTIAWKGSSMPPKRLGWWKRNRPISCSSFSFSGSSTRASSHFCARSRSVGTHSRARLIRHRDLVLDQQPASGAAELPELRLGIDEALRVADDRVRRLDRKVLAHAAQLVIVFYGTQIRGAFRARVALAAHGEILGGEEANRAVELLAPRLRVVEPQTPDAIALAFGRLGVSEHYSIDRFRRLGGDVAVLDVGGDPRWVALERIAKAARRGPQHRIHVGWVLHEVLLP